MYSGTEDYAHSIIIPIAHSIIILCLTFYVLHIVLRLKNRLILKFVLRLPRSQKFATVWLQSQDLDACPEHIPEKPVQQEIFLSYVNF